MSVEKGAYSGQIAPFHETGVSTRMLKPRTRSLHCVGIGEGPSSVDQLEQKLAYSNEIAAITGAHLPASIKLSPNQVVHVYNKAKLHHGENTVVR